MAALIFSLRLAALRQQAARVRVVPLVTVRFSRAEAQVASVTGILTRSSSALASRAHPAPGAVAAFANFYSHLFVPGTDSQARVIPPPRARLLLRFQIPIAAALKAVDSRQLLSIPR